MKHKYLLATVSALLVVGCGNTKEPTEEEKEEIRLRALERKQKVKEDYMFSTFERTAGTDYFSEIDYTLVDYSTEKPRAVTEYRADGCIRTKYEGWPVKEQAPKPKPSSLEWTDYKEEGKYSLQYLSTVNRLVNNLKQKGFELSEVLQANGTVDYSFQVWNNDRLSMTIPQPKYSFHTLLTSMLLRDTVPSSDLHRYLLSLGYVRTLIGLKYQDKALTLVEQEDSPPILVLADEFRKRNYHKKFPDKIDSDVPVTQAQIDEWNQVFIDALKEDPFFGKQMSEPADASGNASTLGAMKGQSGVDAAQLRVNGVAGAQVDLGLPVYVQLKGDVDDRKTTEGVTGLVAYRFGNTVVGAIQSYANASHNVAHTETSMVAAQLLGNMYVEGQLGSVSFEGGSGMRSQVRVGIDTPYGMPFVQLTHRDFGAKTDTAAYVGLEVSSLEIKTAEYTFNTHAMAKVGRHSDKGSVGAIEGTAKLAFSDGLAIDTQLTLESQASPKLSLNVSFEQ